MYKKLVIIVLLFSAVVICAQAQSDSPILVKRFNGNVAFDTMQEWANRVSKFREKASDSSRVRVVIRLCSSKSLKTTISNATLSFPAILEIFEGYQFERKNIIILKSTDCAVAKSRSTPTELWVTEDEKLLPEYSEKYVASDLCIASIIGTKTKTGKKQCPYKESCQALRF